MEKEQEKVNPAAEEQKDKLFYRPKTVFAASPDDAEKAGAFCEGYKLFLDAAKTEREAVATAVALAERHGFVPFESGKNYAPGDRIYLNNRGKAVIFAVMGREKIENGVHIAAAHIDSPRLDLKPNPLYEDTALALFKTHYYGGIKKYQWTAIPLALHGVVAKKDGSVVKVRMGEDDGDPRFVVTDLLPHLAKEQYKRTLNEGIKGEELNVLVGSRPFDGSDESENVKRNILHILSDKYGMDEADFLSAELEVVPAFKACDIGFDRSMIGAYGHDDRVCAYPALQAILETKTPSKTALCVLTDKEETGSDGPTGLNSDYMRDFIHELADAEGAPLYRVLRNSRCLSADVNVGFDPTFSSVSEKNNSSYLNKGVVITKYTGAGGKSSTNDASAEFMAFIRALLDGNGIVWQAGELGAVDAGGGGTVAKYVSKLNVDTVDLGVPVLSMHAPFEVVAKTDIYMAERAFFCFLSM